MDLLKPIDRKQQLLAWLPQGVVLLTVFLFSVYWLVSLGFQNSLSFSFSRAVSFPSIDYMKIGKGPFAISLKGVSPEFEPLVKELVIIGKNRRPDSGALSMISLGFKTSGDKQQIIAGQKLYLARNGDSYKFTDEKTDLSILPLPTTGSDVLLEIETPSQKEEVVLTSSPLFEQSLDGESYVQSLKKGKMWPTDLFLHQWGGEEYRDLSAKHKVEIDHKVYFLSVGDLLSWDGSEWKIGTTTLDEAPLAKLISASGQKMAFEVWNPSGYLSSQVTVDLQSSKAPQKVEEAIASVRPRSPSEITCQLGKRRVIVKEGDWWIKTDRRWRSLRTADDLEAFLHHDIQGELFIFEKIENMKGRTVVKGRCFDKMRSESLPLSLVINTEKKSHASPGKNGASQPPLLAKNKMAVPPIQQKSEGEEKQ